MLTAISAAAKRAKGRAKERGAGRSTERATGRGTGRSTERAAGGGAAGVAAAVVCLLAGVAQAQPAVSEDERALFPGAVECQTVRLFEKKIRRPKKSVPAAWRAFSGHWSGGAWDGKLCHELVIERIGADGAASVLDLQGEYQLWRRRPNAFRRVGELREDGTLRLRHGTAGTATYWIEGDVMFGVYDWPTGRVRVTLRKR